jgi:hypothetical protein
MKVISVLLVASFLMVSMLAHAAKKNLLQNPGFENEQHLDRWATDGNATFIWTETWHPHGDSWAFGAGNDLEWAQDAAGARCLQVLCDPTQLDKLHPVAEGDVVNFSMYVMAEEGYSGQASLKIEFFGYDRRKGFSDPPLAFFQSKTETGGFEWKEMRVSGAAPKGTVSAAVSCLSDNMTKGCKYVWFDDGSVALAVKK